MFTDGYWMRLVLLSLCVASSAPMPFNASASLDSDTLNKGQTIYAPTQLTAGSGQVRLQVQGDGNLVVVQGQNTVLWASNTGPCDPDGQCHLFLGEDGNVAYYGCPNCGKILWETNTTSGVKLVMQSDCNLVLYDGSNGVLWASNTACQGPTPTPPTPPSPPSPPTPPSPPGPLPPLPNKQWFGMWGSNTDGSVDPHTFSSLIWDDPVQDTDIQQNGGPSMRFLYPAQTFFCQPGTKCSLYPDYQQRWNAAVPQLQQYLSQQKILGFFVGDEFICKGAGDQLNTMVNAIRASFPVGSAIIWANECHSTYCDGSGGRRRRRKSQADNSLNWTNTVPSGLDWISIDHYRGDTSSGFIKDLKENCYESDIYPKLSASQKVAIIPQVGHPRDNSHVCDDKCMAGVELQDAKDTVDWAKGDSRVALVAPYAWRRDGKVEQGLDQLGDNTDLKNFWINYGKGTK